MKTSNVLVGVLLLPVMAVSAVSETPPAVDVDHSLWDDVLKSIVIPNVEREGIQFNAVNYDLLRNNTALRQKHLDYINMLSTTNIDALSGEEAGAFMINAYNAFIVDLIVKKNVKGSITDLHDPFKGSVYDRFKWELTITNETEKFSLNNVHHQILRETLTEHNEPRLFGALHCAALGSPDLRAKAFTSTNLEKQLNEQMDIWLQNEGKGVRLDKEKNEIYLSSVLKWFRVDFVSTKHGGKNDLIDAKDAVEYAIEFTSPDIKDHVEKNNPKMKFMPFNWDLNQFQGDTF